MASTGSLAVAVGSAAAALTFAVVSVVGVASSRPDLSGPVVVEAPSDAPAAQDGAEPESGPDEN
ncbi:MAG TPA: hypothetical protein VK925_02240 [Jiangellaceae bacterium]|nr:hypothetical protein [Jiangellaceae bacterium]